MLRNIEYIRILTHTLQDSYPHPWRPHLFRAGRHSPHRPNGQSGLESPSSGSDSLWQLIIWLQKQNSQLLCYPNDPKVSKVTLWSIMWKPSNIRQLYSLEIPRSLVWEKRSPWHNLARNPKQLIFQLFHEAVTNSAAIDSKYYKLIQTYTFPLLRVLNILNCWNPQVDQPIFTKFRKKKILKKISWRISSLVPASPTLFTPQKKTTARRHADLGLSGDSTSGCTWTGNSNISTRVFDWYHIW